MYPLSEQQRLFLVESAQLYESWMDAKHQADSHKYGMKWLKSKGHEYLIRLVDAKGNGKSLGPRSPETEAIYKAFVEGKSRSERRFKGLDQRVHEQARLNRAARLGRLPVVVGDILQAIDQTRARDDFIVVGTHALYAYESLAGVHIKMELLASGDVDLLYDPRKKLSLVANNLDGGGMLGLLRKVDASFEPVSKQNFRAVNDRGFMVDLIIPARDMHHADAIQFAIDDLRAAEVPSLQWLTNAPHVDPIVIASNGMPVRARVPDPRAFAVHKSWLSQQPDRDPVKKVRDLAQSKMVFSILHEYLPNFPLDLGQMRYFPRGVLREGIGLADEKADQRVGVSAGGSVREAKRPGKDSGRGR